MSERPPPDPAEQWRRLYAIRESTGLHPLLLDTLRGQPERPWQAGELRPAPVGAIDALDAEAVLHELWQSVLPLEEEEEDLVRLPFTRWPGLAPALHDGTAGDQAGLAAGRLAGLCGGGRLLGLVPATRGADAPARCGWTGPTNHTDRTERISAVIRSWEDRFGAVVVGLGFDTLDLSVATPPVTVEQARRIAVEHHACCPDTIGQGTGDFEEYARELVGAAHWSFWWD